MTRDEIVRPSVFPWFGTASRPHTRPRSQIEGVDWFTPMLAFIALQLVKLGAVIWKLDKIGLVPKDVADFVSRTPLPRFLEVSG